MGFAPPLTIRGGRKVGFVIPLTTKERQEKGGTSFREERL